MLKSFKAKWLKYVHRETQTFHTYYTSYYFFLITRCQYIVTYMYIYLQDRNYGMQQHLFCKVDVRFYMVMTHENAYKKLKLCLIL